MEDPLLASYEELPYESFPLRDAHPDVLGVAGRLRGMSPAPVERCRVLELGCATGGNLLPIALAHPESRVVGIDLSPRQIEIGKAMAGELGLANLDLQATSILDIEPAFGQFDYILCHGVFSWVPEVVREKILSICRHNLAPAGIAYISYNTYPGWHVRGMFRDMLAYRSRKAAAPRRKVAQARGLLEFLAKTIDNPQGAYSRLMLQEAELLGKTSDTYLFHEHLEEFNQPLHFHEFAHLCAEQELAFLGETRLSNVAAAEHTGRVREALAELAEDPVEREQYLDFLLNRTFRHSLVVHVGQQLWEAPRPQALAGLWAESNVFPLESSAALHDATPVRIKTREGADCIISARPQKAVLKVLNDTFPGCMSVDALAARLGAPQDPICQVLLDSYMRGLVEIRCHSPRLVTSVSAAPQADPLARLQAQQGVTRLSTPRHRSATIGDFARLVLACLDGQQTHEQIAQAVAQRIAAGEFALTFQDQPVTDPGMIREGVEALLPDALAELAGTGVLIA